MVLVWRVLATLTGVNLVALAVFVGLATLQFDAILSGLIRERLVVLAETVRDPFQSVAELGLPLSTVRNSRAVLERARLSDDAIQAIHVFGPGGELVDSTSPSAPARVSAEAIAGRDADAAGVWHYETKSSFMVGASINRTGGERAGAIVLEYSKQGAVTQVQAMEAKLVLLAGLVLLATLVLGFVVLRLVLNEHLRIFEGVLATFDRFEQRFWRGTRENSENEPEVSGLGLRTAEFRRLLEASDERYRMAILQVPADSQPANR